MAYLDSTLRTRRHTRFGVFAMLRQMHALARQRRALADLDAHLRADIGVNAQEAQKEAKRPIWDAPDHWFRR
ncbi:protein of unknown function [Cognatiyoonia koreensis]|uniref:YjiS-like domain-containing protein n=1 Tax=Cognatiyoonia koreensis TaxID=364200 RepID=A0A1I0QCD1_9RHOB|nr:DUF1127 domain-containing protein [Cognatiyoonia koreensis]SEW24700.1 protein of unknown function [Cognatiyoonia koreensis]